jgi:hypothetical protein
MIDKEFYFFDCFGLYHKKKVFSETDIELANTAFEISQKKNKGIKYYNVFDTNEIFIKLINHIEIKKICRLCFGEEYRLDHAFIINQKPDDKITKGLHGKCFGKNMSHYYISHGQEHLDYPCWTKTGQLSVGLVLKEQNIETGGFCYIPGSHKTSYQVSGQNVHEAFLNNYSFKEYVKIPSLEPGDLIAMPECLVHGQTEMIKGERRIVYGMFFPLGNKFMDFSNEYKNIKNITNNIEFLEIFREPPTNMLETKTSKNDISPYKEKKN